MAKEIETDPTVAALDVDNENYDSEEDSDFELDEADVAGDDSGLSSEDEDEDEVDNSRPTKKRRLDASHKANLKKRKADVADEMELDSGDEATILKAKRKKKKKAGEDGDEEDIDIELSEGEGGGFVKTRAMRMKMQEDRRPLAKIDGATIDVDALWAKMNAPNTDSGLLQSQKPMITEVPDNEPAAIQETEKPTDVATQDKLPSEDMIKIKRTYKFAGEIHTEEKLVPRDSAEAKLYLAETTDVTPTDSADVSQGETVTIKLRRPLRKISRFDPNPTGVIKKSWEKQAVQAMSGDADELKGPKLNTVEKSKLDWAQYVDKAGIKDELNVHSKAKEGYLGRMDFLNRVDAIREEERRNIRLKGI
ncbi:swr complex subunit [Talaromyces marneffei ATCC 18224]|uniref:SWR1-complex protein 5 n=2 Tax=Talaromyces marneffei TaxID=37727 RepID=B6QBL7_TALMQ|nr:uncharacterized protein EYB26_006166 [Talaromyces marneffei]EEA26458.1 Swr1p complex component (Swc5), putative [Talaromyces marneffei ATCC 18224]KAE8555146.1 hypothetical protein EYB25_003694 [Talaromyces marneffei]QGA18481.1 hypothetical protein EYB26_006166 [Talaromyces marneffei]